MNCEHARRLLLLWIGRDLADASEVLALQTHLSSCEGCRKYEVSLQRSLDVLQAASITVVESSSRAMSRPSLWPRVMASLPLVTRGRDRFNGWIPAAGIALAASLMVAVSISSVQRELSGSHSLTWKLGPQSPSDGRNLFNSDPHFAPGAFHEESQSRFQPARNRFEW